MHVREALHVKHVHFVYEEHSCNSANSFFNDIIQSVTIPSDSDSNMLSSYTSSNPYVIAVVAHNMWCTWNEFRDAFINVRIDDRIDFLSEAIFKSRSFISLAIIWENFSENVLKLLKNLAISLNKKIKYGNSPKIFLSVSYTITRILLF